MATKTNTKAKPEKAPTSPVVVSAKKIGWIFNGEPTHWQLLLRLQNMANNISYSTCNTKRNSSATTGEPGDNRDYAMAKKNKYCDLAAPVFAKTKYAMTHLRTLELFLDLTSRVWTIDDVCVERAADALNDIADMFNNYAHTSQFAIMANKFVRKMTARTPLFAQFEASVVYLMLNFSRMLAMSLVNLYSTILRITQTNQMLPTVKRLLLLRLLDALGYSDTATHLVLLHYNIVYDVDLIAISTHESPTLSPVMPGSPNYKNDTANWSDLDDSSDRPTEDTAIVFIQ